MNPCLLKCGILATILFCACKKEKNTSTPTPPGRDSTMKYTIEGFQDTILLYEGDSTRLPLRFFRTYGKHEQLNLSVGAVPEGLMASFGLTSGIPSFSSTLTVKHHTAPLGFYKLVIESSTATNRKKSGITLGVLDVCDKELSGTYENHRIIDYNYWKHDTTAPATVETTVYHNKILFKNLLLSKDLPSQITGTLDCVTKTLTVHAYDFFYSVAGTGVYTDSTITLNMTFLTDPESKTYAKVHCTLKRK